MTHAFGCVVSHIGNSRDNQEDNFFLQKGVYASSDARDKMAETRDIYCHNCELNKQRLLVAVSDGMGGHASGEVASFLTVEYLSSHYDEIIDSARQDENALATQISRINSAVSLTSKKDSSCCGMGATLCGVVANEYELIGFNIGDSRLYQYNGGELRQLSTDHTEGQRLLKMRLLTEEEVKKFPRRKMLHKYLGYDGEIVPDVFRITCAEQGSILMLCTDGLTDVLSDKEIEQVLQGSQGIEDKAKLLVNKAVAGNVGYGDNITLILIEF